MSTLKVNTIQDTSGGSGSTPAQIEQGRAKSWCCLNAEGTETINDSFNVSSLTDNGTGDYVINFSTALANANCTVSVNCSRGDDNGGDVANWGGVHTKATSSFALGLWQTNSGLSASMLNNRAEYCEICDLVIFGD